jgi:zinc transport system ATP-binding protein
MRITKASTIIEAKHLTFTRNDEEVLHDFSFAIHEGDYVGVIGPNGGGKTTLLRLLLGLEKPTSGGIKILGGSPIKWTVRQQIGYVAQRGGSLDNQFPATVEEVVKAGRTPRLGWLGVWRKTDTCAVDKAMKEMNIEKLRERPMSRLSGGERQKVMLARAMAAEPKILFLDEPVDGLDPQSREDFYKLLRSINKRGVTIIFVSHDVHAISREAGSALCLKHQLVCHGNKSCHIQGTQLRDLFHETHENLVHHHAT